MPRHRIIIGQGTASQVYQFTGRQGDLETLVIGPEGLWGTLPEGHAMGQPPHLLALPGQPVPAFQTASGKTAEGLKGFQDVKTFQGNVQQLAQTNPVPAQNKFPNTKVKKIAKGLLGLDVSVECNGREYTIGAEQVIFATGIGPQQTPEMAKITVKGTPDTSLPFKQMEEGIEYLAHADKLGQVVVVYGGAATGAWVAAEVNAHLGDRGDWIWVTRSDFSKSELPGDRNHKILAIEAHQRKECSIQEAVYYAKSAFYSDADISWPPRPMIRLLLKKGSTPTPFWCDQLIYCIGRNPGAEGSIAEILGPLKDTLVPIRDKNSMVSDGNGVLAWGTSDRRSIMIVGSATFNFLTTSDKAQDAPMDMLPPNAQVPDGIAVTVSTIEALNEYMPLEGFDTPREKWNINLNTSNRTQIAAEIARNTDLDPFTANLFVAMITYMRGKNNFGLDTRSKQEGGRDHAGLILHEVKDFVALMRKSGTFDNVRKILERMYGVDKILFNYIECMTTADVWKQFWKRNGLEC